MKSVIYTFLTPDRREQVGIGSHQHLANLPKTQLIRVLYWETNEEEWDEIMNTPRQQLAGQLLYALDTHLFTQYVN